MISLIIGTPNVATFPVAWDSVLYMRALDEFRPAPDPHVGQPHPPGYIFYILVARVGAALLSDPHAGLIAVSLAGSALAVAAGTLLATALFGRVAGVFACAVLIANPLLLFYSEIAYPYTLLAGLSAVIAGAVWWARRGGRVRIAVAGAALGAASGFRQDLLLLAPLGLHAAARVAHGPTIATVAGALAALAWFVPSAIATGGAERYAAVTTEQFLSNSAPTGGQSFRENVILAVYGVGGQVRWLAPFLAIGLWVALRQYRGAFTFFALWTAPLLVFYLVAHIGEFGYALSLAVPIAIITALGIRSALERGRAWAALAAAALIAGIALNTSTFALEEGRFSVDRLRLTERDVTTRLQLVRTFDPSETVVVAEFWYMHVLHYLPEYRSEFYPLRPAGAERVLVDETGPRVIVLFDREIPLDAGVSFTRVTADGSEVRYVRLAASERLVRRLGELTVQP